MKNCQPSFVKDMLRCCLPPRNNNNPGWYYDHHGHLHNGLRSYKNCELTIGHNSFGTFSYKSAFYENVSLSVLFVY